MSKRDTRTLSRYDRRRLETRGRILAAAGELFGQQGVEKTTVLDICEQADVAQQTFFNHFPSKADLLLEMARMGREFLIASIDTALAKDATTSVRLQEIFSGLFSASVAVGPMHHEFVTEVFRGARSHRLGDDAARLQNAFMRLVRAGQAQGDVTRKHNASEITRIVAGSLAALSGEWTSKPEFPIKRRARALARVLGELLTPNRAGHEERS